MENVEFKDSQKAFSEAIFSGRLSNQESSPLYAGNFMYMGTWNGKDQFKNINTRSYIN